jgi:uncharacterized protein
MTKRIMGMSGKSPSGDSRGLKGQTRIIIMKIDVPVPTEEECYRIMKRHHMLDNIMKHSIQVMNVSMALVDNLRDPSLLQASLVQAAALLHDIAKTRTIGSKELRHDLIGGQVMREMGYDDIAVAVESHVVFERFNPIGSLEAREIVFYSDKRVMHDRIVSIDERVDDLVNRYGINQHIVNLITENKVFVLEMEKKIQGFLSRNIEDILSGLC